MTLIKKTKENIILLIGIAIRVVMPFFAYDIPQHDVFYDGGHFEYALYIMKNLRLADTNYYEFHQPPLNAIMQAAVTKITSIILHTKDYRFAYTYNIYLSMFYSILTIIIIKKILDELVDIGELKEKWAKIILAIFAVYPGMLIMGVQVSNDPMATMFFYLSLFYTIKWFKSEKISDIIILALSIGFGMLTKVSVGIIAFITGPIMIYKLFKNHKLIKELIIFAIIVFPLGLCYEIRNNILFGQLPGTIYELGPQNIMYLGKNKYTIFERFLSFPINRLYDKNRTIFHTYKEYNVWIDLVKTSTFDEIGMNGKIIKKYLNIGMIIYILNIIFYLVSFVAIITDIIKQIIRRKINFSLVRILAYSILIVAVFSYVAFNLRYPYSCNSNWRYIPYITFAQALFIGLLFEKKYNDEKI